MSQFCSFDFQDQTTFSLYPMLEVSLLVTKKSFYVEMIYLNYVRPEVCNKNRNNNYNKFLFNIYQKTKLKEQMLYRREREKKRQSNKNRLGPYICVLLNLTHYTSAYCIINKKKKYISFFYE